MQGSTRFGTIALGALLIAAAAAPAFARDHGRGPGMLDGLFERFDANGDGRITREEIANHRAERIAALDADGDGFVSRDEAIAFARTEAAARAERAAGAMFDRADADGDGRLSAAEVMTAADRAGAPSLTMMFDRLDADGDGAITRAEAEAARAAMRARGKPDRSGEGRGGRHHGGGN
ncbi:MAG: EF-hand domain-containing protein [Gemmobacter sp.]